MEIGPLAHLIIPAEAGIHACHSSKRQTSQKCLALWVPAPIESRPGKHVIIFVDALSPRHRIRRDRPASRRSREKLEPRHQSGYTDAVAESAPICNMRI